MFWSIAKCLSPSEGIQSFRSCRMCVRIASTYRKAGGVFQSHVVVQYVTPSDTNLEAWFCLTVQMNQNCAADEAWIHTSHHISSHYKKMKGQKNVVSHCKIQLYQQVHHCKTQGVGSEYLWIVVIFNSFQWFFQPFVGINANKTIQMGWKF